MSDLQDLYQEVILDHSKAPRNFLKLPQANHHAEGFNPLCGDHITVYLHLEAGRVKAVSFEGSGCAISKASASIMTTQIKGKTVEEVSELFEKFHQMVTGDPEKNKELVESLGKLKAFSGVCEYPTRVKCASLPWHTLKAAMEDTQDAATTE
jgi:nitrogen fixation NifU-like protein